MGEVTDEDRERAVGTFWAAFRERWPGIAAIPCVSDALAYAEFLEGESFERVTALRLGLRALLDFHDEPCRFDHESFCQAHMSSRPCVVAAARALLGEEATHDR